MNVVRAIPEDVLAFAVIAIAMIVTHVPMLHYGMCFNDPSWYFHFGQQTLHGAVPYRDYLFQVGPMPIYVDATFQHVFGERYVASLYAALLLHVVRVWLAWAIARRSADRIAATLLCVYCAFDPLFSFAHHWSTTYAELFFTLSGLFVLLALRAEGRRALWYLGLAGASAGLIMASRQSTAVMIAVLLAPATLVLLVRKQLSRASFLAFWGGFAAAVAALALFLLAIGALGPAIQQMFFDAAEKKGLHGIDAFFDAISGGAMANGSYSRVGGFLHWIALPTLIVAAIAGLGARERMVSTRALALLVVPIALLVGLVLRYTVLEPLTDLPRTFLTAVVAFAVIFPGQIKSWFGLDPLLALVFGGMALASDWALEMSFPGRGWGDPWGLITGGLWIALLSTRVSALAKRWLCGGFAAIAITSVILFLQAGRNPFAKPDASDGTFAEITFTPRMHHAHQPMLRGLRLPEWRSLALEWLASEIPEGSTCFVYANLPSLYDLLQCKNPTRLDDTITDYFTAADAEEAIAVMRQHPPDFILAHDRMWLSPPISLDLGDRIDHYESWNAKASMAMHVGLRSIIDQYESLGTVGEAIGPEQAAKAAKAWDAIDAVHLYRRK